MVVEADGKSIVNNRAASYLLLPGAYQVKVQARKDLKTGVSGDLISVYFEDKGPGFPAQCLPLYVAVKVRGAVTTRGAGRSR